MYMKSGKLLQGKVLETMPGLMQMRPTRLKLAITKEYTIILSNVVKRLLIVLNFLWIKVPIAHRLIKVRQMDSMLMITYLN